jgi:glycine hydroxymethyltransferase
VNEETGLIDCESLEIISLEFKPNMIICGASDYPSDMVYKRLRDICDKVGALLMADVFLTSGLIVTKLLSSPFECAEL